MPRQVKKWAVRPEEGRLRRYDTFEGAARYAVRCLGSGSPKVHLFEPGGWASLRAFIRAGELCFNGNRTFQQEGEFGAIWEARNG